MRRRRRKRKHTQSGSSADKNKAPKMKNAKNMAHNQINDENDDEILRKNKHKKCKKTKLTIWDGIILFLLLMENGLLDEFFTMDEFEEINEDYDYQDFNIFKPNSKKTNNKHTNRETHNAVDISSSEATNNIDYKSVADARNYYDFDYLSED